MICLKLPGIVSKSVLPKYGENRSGFCKNLEIS